MGGLLLEATLARLGKDLDGRLPVNPWVIGHVHLWIRNCLKGRKQRVSVNGLFSKGSIDVPQAAVLGPVLPTRAVNDLEKEVSSEVAKIANEKIIHVRIWHDWGNGQLNGR